MAWMKIKDYAAHRGVSPRMVLRYIERGRIPASATKPRIPGGKQLLINQGPADKFLSENLRPKPEPGKVQKKSQKKLKAGSKKLETVRRAGIKITASLNEANKLDKEYSAALKKIQLEERQGALVPKAEVEREAFNLGRQIRDAMLSIPDRLSDQLAVATDSLKIYKILKDEIMHALRGLSE